jgi:hypothetical protein
LTLLDAANDFFLGPITVAAEASVENIAAAITFPVIRSVAIAGCGAAAVNAVVSITTTGIIPNMLLATVKDIII